MKEEAVEMVMNDLEQHLCVINPLRPAAAGALACNNSCGTTTCVPPEE